jgi:signal transduction histidine kinase
MLGFMAAEKNQTIKINLPPIPIYAYINRGQISRVVGNLLRNAIKFSYEGQCIEISVESEAGANVLIKVKDAGIGIPESKHRELFNIFTSSQSIGTGGEKPFGLGLYISRQIIEAHGGTITFESKENEGTTFYVRLQQ